MIFQIWWEKWIKGGSFHSFSLQWMDHTLPWNVRLVAPKQWNNITNSKNLIPSFYLSLLIRNIVLFGLVLVPQTTLMTPLFFNQLWEYITAGSILHQSVLEIESQAIPPLILGDGAFPVRTWIIKPYGHAILNEQKCYLNCRLTRARMVTEGAFEKLKGRWKVLSKKCESNPQLSKGLA